MAAAMAGVLEVWAPGFAPNLRMSNTRESKTGADKSGIAEAGVAPVSTLQMTDAVLAALAAQFA